MRLRICTQMQSISAEWRMVVGRTCVEDICAHVRTLLRQFNANGSVDRVIVVGFELCVHEAL